MMRSGLGVALAAGALTLLAPAGSADPLPAFANPNTLTLLAANEQRRKTSRQHSRAKDPDTKSDDAKKRDAGTRDEIPPLPERKSAAAAAPPPDVWSAAEIEAAKARCAAVLKGLDAEVEPQPPLKEGKCGAPAPVRLISLGKAPRVEFSPPALVNCEMVGALDTWMRKDLQPLARQHLGGSITKVEVMSDYSCRAAAGRVAGRLSEHAYVDALDIRGFVIGNGKVARVLEAWGTTGRDLAAQADAAKALAAKDAADRTAADKDAQKNLADKKSGTASDKKTPVVLATSLGMPGAGLAKRTGADKITVTLPGARKNNLGPSAAKLGGPPDAADKPGSRLAALSPETSLLQPPPGPQSKFLHAAHDAACRIFGTTLGPEANEAHRNHFHVDMAERKFKKICDF